MSPICANYQYSYRGEFSNHPRTYSVDSRFSAGKCNDKHIFKMCKVFLGRKYSIRNMLSHNWIKDSMAVILTILLFLSNTCTTSGQQQADFSATQALSHQLDKDDSLLISTGAEELESNMKDPCDAGNLFLFLMIMMR